MPVHRMKDISRPSERGRRGDAIAKIKTKAEGHRKKVTEQAARGKTSPETKRRSLASRKKLTERRLAEAKDYKYTSPEGPVFGRKFKKKTAADRAKQQARSAARKKKRASK